jgi:signal transduction histidine kinase
VIIQLKNNDQCVGVLFLNFRKPRKFSPWEQKRFSVFADLAALSIQKMQVQQHIIQKEKADLAYFNHNYLLGGTFGIFRLLKTINLNSNFYPKEKLQETIAQVIDTTGQLHNSIRWIDRMLKEEGFEDLMLELDRLREFFKQVFKVNTEIKWVGNAHQIPQNLSMELSLVFREALNNSVRHGKAKNIIVNNYVKSGKLNSTIVDDGIGFDPKTIKRMNGLLSMKYRIEEIGGSFKLTSNPGKGTKIVIRIPFQNSTEA